MKVRRVGLFSVLFSCTFISHIYFFAPISEVTFFYKSNLKLSPTQGSKEFHNLRFV